MSTLDRIDIAILRDLAEGRPDNQRGACRAKVGLSQSACSRRLDNLEKTGTIRGYHARLSHKALGHKMIADRAHLAVRPVREDAVGIRGGGEALPERAVCHLMSGEYDYILRSRRARTSTTTSASTGNGCRRCRMSSRSTRPSRCARSSTAQTSDFKAASKIHDRA